MTMSLNFELLTLKPFIYIDIYFYTGQDYMMYFESIQVSLGHLSSFVAKAVGIRKHHDIEVSDFKEKLEIAQRKNSELETKAEEDMVKIGMAEEMQSSLKVMSEKFSNENKKLRSDVHELEKAKVVLEKNIHDMTDQIKSLLKDKEIAKSTTDQTELEVSRLRIDIQRLSEVCVKHFFIFLVHRLSHFHQ